MIYCAYRMRHWGETWIYIFNSCFTGIITHSSGVIHACTIQYAWSNNRYMLWNYNLTIHWIRLRLPQLGWMRLIPTLSIMNIKNVQQAFPYQKRRSCFIFASFSWVESSVHLEISAVPAENKYNWDGTSLNFTQLKGMMANPSSVHRLKVPPVQFHHRDLHRVTPEPGQ